MWQKRKIEGYWNNSRNDYPEYPLPVPNALSIDEANEIADMIVGCQLIAIKDGYLGPTTSRITGERLGWAEYELDDWIWPGDFAEHYVRTHRVKPTDEFLTFVKSKQ